MHFCRTLSPHWPGCMAICNYWHQRLPWQMTLGRSVKPSCGPGQCWSCLLCWLRWHTWQFWSEPRIAHYICMISVSHFAYSLDLNALEALLSTPYSSLGFGTFWICSSSERWISLKCAHDNSQSHRIAGFITVCCLEYVFRAYLIVSSCLVRRCGIKLLPVMRNYCSAASVVLNGATTS